MAKGVNIDGVLVTWGDRLFYPGLRARKDAPQPRLRGDALHRRAAAIRSRIEATVVGRAAPGVGKVTGGGRGMRAIAAHFRYISKNGRFDLEDDRGETVRGKQAVRDLAEDWRFSGSLIPEDADGTRREAFNIMLSMPRGTDPLAVQLAAREFAWAELSGHKYVMVLHDHQANPHVHISVRAESRSGRRLNPRKADLARWRETFAEKLRDLGVEAEATRQVVRGGSRVHPALWQLRARKDGRLRVAVRTEETSSGVSATRMTADRAWAHVAAALTLSDRASDLHLARNVTSFLEGNIRQHAARSRSEQQPEAHRVSSEVTTRNR